MGTMKLNISNLVSLCVNTLWRMLSTSSVTDAAVKLVGEL